MEHDFWHQIWDEDDIAFHQGDVHPLLAAHWPERIGRKHRVLVPLCGKSLDMIWLRRQGCEVVGVELSPVAVDAFFSEHDITAERTPTPWGYRMSGGGFDLLVGDIFDLHNADVGRIDAVYDRASLVAFPAVMRLRFAEQLARLTSSRGPVFSILFEYDDPELSGPPFSVDETEVAELFPEYRLVLVDERDAIVRRRTVREYVLLLEPA